MKKSERAVIVGQSGSGKDHLMRKLAEKGMKPCLKWTTRPMRKFEKQGVQYNFVNEVDFLNAIENNEFINYQEFNVTPENSEPQKWYYGITKDEFNNSQIFIMTPGELKEIPKDLRKECCIIYLDIDRDIREKRLLKREDVNDSVKRRLDSDEVDFKDEFDYDVRITDPEFGADDIYELLM